MVTLIGTLSCHEDINKKQYKGLGCHNNNSKQRSHALRNKHILSLKCKNFYKYRLRKNGEEDSDVIDVSNILLSTLRIKSPSKILRSPEKNCNNIEDIRPKNYLFKMGRRKQKAQTLDTEGEVKKEKGGDKINKPTLLENEIKPKKPTNAFQLLMDSRNKSIGSNSPGKEITIDTSEVQEIEKKKLKVKRNLALQKMAEAKGSIKKKQQEEYEDNCIKKLMEKRAERLKNMLEPKLNKASKKIKEPSKVVENVIEIEDNSSSNDNRSKVVKIDNRKKKSLHLVDMFKKSNNISPDKKVVCKEDEEFLSKLSPSIKKKENMLCYFKKIDKKSSPDTEEDTDDDRPVLKVKMSSKHKNKLKKKRLTLQKKSKSIVLMDLNENSCGNNDIVIAEREIAENSEYQEQQGKSSKERNTLKRKENIIKATDLESDQSKTISSVEPVQQNTDEIQRPKRNVKRPIKYMDDVQFSSSDDELHIFTPRKKKHRDNKDSHLIEKTSEEVLISDDESKKQTSTKFKKNTRKEKGTEKVQKNLTKLAPIFTPKPQLKPEELEAKQKFLYSGVPDQIKKIVSQQKSHNIEITSSFPVVVHVQQKESSAKKATKNVITLNYSSEDDSFDDSDKHTFASLMTNEPEKHTYVMPTVKNNVTAVLQNIKECYPQFPVHRTFRLLKTKSKGELKDSLSPDLENSSVEIDSIVDVINDNPEFLIWTDKYKATSTKNLIGNFESIKELKRWLLSWAEIERRPKTVKNKESDSSDFYDSDSNSRDSIKNNLLIVTGPIGCGKTSSVYAVAAELAIKVIEVNASSKRTGKVMLQDLQEATQSHKVNRGGSDNSQKSQEIVETVTPIINKKRGRPKKFESSLMKNRNKNEVLSQSQQTASQEQTRTGMSLILIDDADIVFDQDDGFSSAIAQLIQSSKRPVILVTGTLTCPHLQRFLQYGKVINMQPLLPKMLGTWLDIMCLAEGSCWQGLGAKVLDYYKGDIRKSINGLQFYMTANTQDSLKCDEASQNSDFKQTLDEENSNMSWPDSEEIEEKKFSDTTTTDARDIFWKSFMHKQANLLHLRYPKDLLNVWWNVPRLLNTQPDFFHKDEPNLRLTQKLETLANVFDSFSISDYYSSNGPDTACNITSTPWYSSESNSVSEQDSLDNYNRCHEDTSSIVQSLVSNSITEAQILLQCERNVYIQYPSMAVQRQKDRLTSRHDNLTNILNPSTILDRRALALDYWSTCRTICRIEKNKTDTVSKRNNRFCHYLKSINVMCRNDVFDALGDSLSLRGKEE